MQKLKVQIKFAVIITTNAVHTHKCDKSAFQCKMRLQRSVGEAKKMDIHSQRMTHQTVRGFYLPNDTLSADATRYDVDVSLRYAKLGVAENMTTIAVANVARFHRVRRHRSLIFLKTTL